MFLTNKFFNPLYKQREVHVKGSVFFVQGGNLSLDIAGIDSFIDRF